MEGNLIAFDLDGTVTKRDTMLAFTQFTHGKIRSSLIYASLSPLIVLAYSSFLSRQYVKEMVLKLHYKGIAKADLLAMGERFSEKVLPGLLTESIFSQLKSHIHEGNKIVILTASCDVWVEPFCRNHQIEFIGSHMEFIDGVCTGNLSNKNCRGEQKYQLLKEYLFRTGYKLKAAYGNETSDLHFMKLAEEKYFVHRGSIKQIQ